MEISPVLRQLLIIFACNLAALSEGGAQGYPIILLLQLREENSTIKLNLDNATWIGSVHGLAGILSIFVTTFMQWRGRKIAFMCGCVIMIIGWFLAYTANSVAWILISEIFQGCAISALSTISYLTLSEVISPKYRNISIQCYSLMHSFGVASSGILSRFVNWRTATMLLSIPTVLALLMSFSWPDSPPWLACKGRFLECEEAFKQLRRMSESSDKELKELIAAQKENLLSKKNQPEQSLSLILDKFKRKDFYLPIVHMFVLITLIYWSGTAVFIINSAEMMQRTTNNGKAIYFGSIATNIALILGMLSTNYLSARYKNKSLVIFCVVSAIACLVGIVVVTLLQDIDIVAKDSWLCPVFIILFVVVSTPGLVAVVFTIISEIMPVKHRGVGGAFYIIFNSILYSSALKISPYLFLYINLWGTCLLYILIILMCGLYIRKFVPETKHRTLQQIEDFYNFGKFIEIRGKCNDDEPFVTDP